MIVLNIDKVPRNCGACSLEHYYEEDDGESYVCCPFLNSLYPEYATYEEIATYKYRDAYGITDQRNPLCPIIGDYNIETGVFTKEN